MVPIEKVVYEIGDKKMPSKILDRLGGVCRSCVILELFIAAYGTPHNDQ
jgi:hypothetical protein